MYRIQQGDEVLLVHEDGRKQDAKMDRTTDFKKHELVASPLEEHHKEGIKASKYLKSNPNRFDIFEWSWGFNVRNKWGNVGTIVEIYTHTVHMVDTGTSLNEHTVVVQGSGTNQYTLVFNDTGDEPISCTCQGYRYKGICKHIKNWTKYVTSKSF